jgi:hypothetical protein
MLLKTKDDGNYGAGESQNTTENTRLTRITRKKFIYTLENVGDSHAHCHPTGGNFVDARIL